VAATAKLKQTPPNNKEEGGSQQVAGGNKPRRSRDHQYGHRGTNMSTLDNIFRVAAVVEQIMTDLNGAVSEDKIMVITKIILKLMNKYGH
jgi:hypothetical protein